MTKDDIITLPHPHLRQRSKKVGVITPEVLKLIQEMTDATLDWEDSRDHEVSVALAAIQVDKPVRVVIIRNDFDNKKDRRFHALINPEITKYEGKLVEDYEGCLSIQDIYGKVPRYERVRIKAIGLDGKEVRLKANGFLARVFQHEIDHCNGIVFIDHIKDSPEAFYKLEEDGELRPLDYESNVRTSPILW